MTFHCRGMTSSVSVRRRQNSPPDCFVILLHLAHLHDAPRSATGAGGRGFDHHALARQMVRERLAGRTATFESRNRGLRRGGIRLCPILPKVRLQILELHLELFYQPGVAFGAVAELLAPEFGDLQLQVPDHRIGGRNDGARLHQFVLCRGRARLCRSEGGTQDSDLRGGLRHAEGLPQGRGLVQ